jgi:hypothetical protein
MEVSAMASARQVQGAKRKRSEDSSSSCTRARERDESGEESEWSGLRRQAHGSTACTAITVIERGGQLSPKPDRSIVRSRAGVRAVSLSLAVLGAAALVQVVIFVLSGSPSSWARSGARSWRDWLSF